MRVCSKLFLISIRITKQKRSQSYQQTAHSKKLIKHLLKQTSIKLASWVIFLAILVANYGATKEGGARSVHIALVSARSAAWFAQRLTNLARHRSL